MSIKTLVLVLSGLLVPVLASAERETKSRRVACAEIRLSWLPAGDSLTRGPETLVVVKNEGGQSGVQFFQDTNGRTVGVKTWSVAGGSTTTSVVPGLPKVDYVDCRDGEPMGGIWVEVVDAAAFGP